MLLQKLFKVDFKEILVSEEMLGSLL
jgi:hypothetical protein